MRAAKVPANIAVTAKGVHYVVSTVNCSASCQAYQQQQQDTRASAAPAIASPFRFTSLLPADWSALLRMCRRLTHPSASFNFSSPGDMAEQPHHHDHQHSTSTNKAAHYRTGEEEQQQPSPVPAAAVPNLQNHAYMHIVERVAGDFTPNNMIYHQLQKFRLLPSADKELSRDDTMAAFTQLVVGLQRQPAQAPQEVAAALLDAEDSARAAATPEQKQSLDPLFANADAEAKSSANAAQLRAYAANAADASTLHTFTFYPYSISAAVSIPYCSAHFCVLVNLKPIVPNHLMVVPIRCVGTMHGLTEEEVEDWGHVMRCTIDVLEDLRQQQHKVSQNQQDTPSVGNYSIAVQQGVLAGQTVEHLHVHVIPFDPQGKLAGEPETDEEEQRRRPPRTPAVMKAETDALRPLFAQHAAAAKANMRTKD